MDDKKHGKGELKFKTGISHKVEWFKDKIKLPIKDGGFFYGAYRVGEKGSLIPDGVGYCVMGESTPVICKAESL